MSNTTIAEYRNLYRDRHQISCPLSDAQILAVLATATIKLDIPPTPAGLAAIEVQVGISYPTVDQNRWRYAGNFRAPSNLVLDNATAGGFDANFSLPTGGNTPYSIQLQLAPDVEGAAGTYVNEGVAQADATEIVVADKTAATKYWARLSVTDHLGQQAYSNVTSITTLAE